jgi:hypothetical protein
METAGVSELKVDFVCLHMQAREAARGEGFKVAAEPLQG